ncbi:C40 family peptidase [Ottowia testudinis]|uniref:C40 family peptidase n=1 Tax=Ottowia testudinis TaxID=2816950 RepID=A0A975H322_9BURK|nr:C40 family peptidase [Ottowia testudinis]QTD44791.1 C40 family peptidase [Ottowia testudinis]
MTGSSSAHATHPSPTRRQWLAALAAGTLLAGCASRRPAPAARGGAPSAGTVARPSPVPPTQTPLALDPAGREASVAQAMLLVNTPYRYGGNTPEGGFDCSGLVHYVFGQVAAGGARLPRSTAQWAAVTVPVDEAALQRGDLVFFNTSGAAFSHMGIYVGGGQFVHAPSTGGTVRKDSVASRYFGPRYLGGRRVFAA